MLASVETGAYEMVDSHAAPSPAWITWLADSPMFTDTQQIGTFYDAVLRPMFRTVELQISKDRMEQLEKSFGAKLGAQLATLFPWLKIDAATEASLAKRSGQSEGESITLQPVESPARQLVELTLHYLVNLPADRVWFHEGMKWQAPQEEKIAASPRMLGFVDVPAGTRFLPLAAELSDGRVVTFFGRLIEKLQRRGGMRPVEYPDDTSTLEGARQRDEYWAWYSGAWNANDVVQVIEDIIGSGGRPRWFDYRILPDAGRALDLHIAGRGEFDTGVFAYNLVKRGWRYGLRIVGNLKLSPAINVLAIYEK